MAGKYGKEKLTFIGDGINDAPVLGRAETGITMGAMGSDAAIENTEVVLMNDDPLQITKAIKISRKWLNNVYHIFADPFSPLPGPEGKSPKFEYSTTRLVPAFIGMTSIWKKEKATRLATDFPNS